MPPVKTGLLLRRARRGDIDAFAELFDPLRGRIYAVAYRYVGPADAEDVVMDTFVQAWQALPAAENLPLKLRLLTISTILDNIIS